MASNLQSKKIGIVGLGLGYSLACYLSSRNHDVVGVDIDEDAYLYPRLDLEMKQWMREVGPRVAHFTTDFWELGNRDFIFIFVSTPFEKGRLSIRNVLSGMQSAVGVNSKAEYAILSTLPIGGMAKIREWFPTVHVSYTPPMIKKHKFLSTFMRPPSGWQLFGGSPSLSLKAIFREAQTAIQLTVEDEIAEAAKLCTNLMLATKVIIANSIGQWLGNEKGAAVCEIVNRDPRIGVDYFTPGGKAAGPCLPRDLMELEEATTGNLQNLIAMLNVLNGTEKLVEVAK